MHETARCIGYPSDSTRAARERGRGGQLAGTASADPGQCGRPVPPPPPSQPPLRPCGSSTPLAPVAHLWPAPGVAHCHRPLVSSRAAYRRARSPARIATVVLAGCSGAGSGWCCRARIAVCTVFLGGPATVGAGPLLCADSWAVTVWRIASAARLCQPRVTGLSTATQSPNSMAPLWLLSRPVRSMGPAGRAEARARAAPVRADSVRVSHRLAHRSHWASALPPLATSSSHWLPSPPAGPCRLGCGPGGRISRPPRPEVTSRHVPIPSAPFSRLHERDSLTRAATPSRPAPVNPCGRCKRPASALNPCIGLFGYLCASDQRSPLLVCALDRLVISVLNFQVSRITRLRAS